MNKIILVSVILMSAILISGCSPPCCEGGQVNQVKIGDDCEGGQCLPNEGNNRSPFRKNPGQFLDPPLFPFLHPKPQLAPVPVPVPTQPALPDAPFFISPNVPHPVPTVPSKPINTILTLVVLNLVFLVALFFYFKKRSLLLFIALSLVIFSSGDAQAQVVRIKSNSGIGSGFIFSHDYENGTTYIMTNRHVVEGSKGDLKIDYWLQGVEVAEDTKHTVMGNVTMIASNVDAAVIACDYIDNKAVMFAKFDDVDIDDEIYAIGCRYGNYPTGYITSIIEKKKSVGWVNYEPAAGRSGSMVAIVKNGNYYVFGILTYASPDDNTGGFFWVEDVTRDLMSVSQTRYGVKTLELKNYLIYPSETPSLVEKSISDIPFDHYFKYTPISDVVKVVPEIVPPIVPEPQIVPFRPRYSYQPSEFPPPQFAYGLDPLKEERDYTYFLMYGLWFISNVAIIALYFAFKDNNKNKKPEETTEGVADKE